MIIFHCLSCLKDKFQNKVSGSFAHILVEHSKSPNFGNALYTLTDYSFPNNLILFAFVV